VASATCRAPGYDWLQIITKTNNFRRGNVFDDMCRIGRRSLWSWFDVNQSTFNEAAREFYIFASSDLDLWPLDLKFAPQLLLSSAMLPAYKAFLLRENRRHGTDRRTGSMLNAAHTEGGIIIWKQQSIAVSAYRRQLRSNAPPVKKFRLRHCDF